MPLKYNDSVVLVGGGPFAPEVFDLVKGRTFIFVAADGGAAALLAQGVIPDAVIGDMDSLSDAVRMAIPPDRLIHVSEQDTTDFDKAVRGIETGLIYALGVMGGRLDHELATLHVLAKNSHRAIILVGKEDVTVHLPARITLDLPHGCRVSLFPLDAVTVGMEGLRWSFEALALHPLGRIGTSNEVGEKGPVVLTSDRPGALLITPLPTLDVIVEGLANADFHSQQASLSAKT